MNTMQKLLAMQEAKNRKNRTEADIKASFDAVSPAKEGESPADHITRVLALKGNHIPVSKASKPPVIDATKEILIKKHFLPNILTHTSHEKLIEDVFKALDQLGDKLTPTERNALLISVLRQWKEACNG
jgi:hypothetical protein